MDKNERTGLAHQIENNASFLLKRMTEILEKEGILDVRVESFTVRPQTDQSQIEFSHDELSRDCPTRCVVLPDGTIRCFPDCG